MNKQFKKDLVSIVLATYNHENFIVETLNSIINQTYKYIEIIVCDDCSTDSTTAKILEFSKKDNRIIPVISSINGGLSVNLNKGFELVNGEYFAIMGGDDIMHPQKIEKQINFLKNNTDYDVVLHYVNVFDSNTKKVMYSFDKNIINLPTDWFFGRTWTSLFNEKKSTFPPTAYLARSIYALNSMYDYRLKYKNEILYAINNYMAKPNAKWYCLPEYLGEYRIHQNNMHTSAAMNDLLMEETYINYGIAISRYPQLAKKLKSTLTYFLFFSLFHEIANPDKNKSHIKNMKKRFLVESGLMLYLFGMFLLSIKRIQIYIYDNIFRKN